MTKRVYNSVVDAVGARGRPPVRWEDRVVEYGRERGECRMRGGEHARKGKNGLFFHDHPLGGGGEFLG